MKRLRRWACAIPGSAFLFRWAVLDGGQWTDVALTRRAALRRRPAAPRFYATVAPIRKADA